MTRPRLVNCCPSSIWLVVTSDLQILGYVAGAGGLAKEAWWKQTFDGFLSVVHRTNPGFRCSERGGILLSSSHSSREVSEAVDCHQSVIENEEMLAPGKVMILDKVAKDDYLIGLILGIDPDTHGAPHLIRDTSAVTFTCFYDCRCPFREVNVDRA
jgi:hypothetical protein